MQRGKIAVAAALGVALVTGCAGPETGTVEHRRYHQPFTTWSTVCALYSSNGGCAAFVVQPQFYPESCDLYLRNGEDKGWRNVPCYTYDRYKIGMTYP